MLLFLKPKTAKTSMFQPQKDSQVHDATYIVLLWIILLPKPNVRTGCGL